MRVVCSGIERGGILVVQCEQTGIFDELFHADEESDGFSSIE